MLLNQPRLTPPVAVHVEDVNDTVVTSQTNVLLPGMSVVTPYRATWAIDFSGSLTFNSNGDVAWTIIDVAGVTIPASERTTGASSANEGGMMACTAIAHDVPAGTTIRALARVNAAASATFHERQLRLLEVTS